jgi:hypothetical protein
LQTFFNHLDLIDRARLYNYTASWISWRAGSSELEAKFGKPFVTAVLRFVSQDESVAFDVHVYLAHDLDILGESKLLDPKAIYFLRRAHFYVPDARQRTQ